MKKLVLVFSTLLLLSSEVLAQQCPGSIRRNDPGGTCVGDTLRLEFIGCEGCSGGAWSTNATDSWHPNNDPYKIDLYYATAGTKQISFDDYTITINGTPNTCDATYGPVVITEKAHLSVTASIDGATSICNLNSITFRATPSQTNGSQKYSYRVNDSNGEEVWFSDPTSSVTKVFGVSGLSPGNYSYYVQLQNLNYSCLYETMVYSSPVSFVVLPTNVIPVNIITNNPDGVCYLQGNGFSIPEKTEWGSGYSIAWKINGSTPSVDDTETPLKPLQFRIDSWPYSTSVQVTAVVTMPNATCPDASPKTSNAITVNIIPPQAFWVNFSPWPSRQSMEYCPGEIRFNATSSHPATFKWYKNNELVSDSISYKPGSISNSDVIKLMGTPNSTVCIDLNDQSSWTKTQTVSAIGSSPYLLRIMGTQSVSNINIHSYGGLNNNISPVTNTRCQGEGWTRFVSDAENNFTGGITWSFIENGSTTNFQNSYNPADAEIGWDPNFHGTVDVKVTVTGCATPAIEVRTITVKPQIAPPTVSISGPAWVCPGDEATFLSSTSALTPQYTWLMDNTITLTSDAPPPGETAPPLSVLHKDAVNFGGGYADIKLKVANTADCSSGDGYSNTIRVWQTLNGVNITPSDYLHCKGTDEDVQFYASSTRTTYNWFVDKSGVHINSSGLIDSWDASVPAQITDSLQVYVAASGCPLIKSHPVYVKFGAPAGAAAVLDTYRFGPGPLSFKATGANSDETYKWYDASDALLSTGQSYKTQSLTTSSTHAYHVRRISAKGCLGPATWIDTRVHPAIEISATSDVVVFGSKSTLSTSTFDTYQWRRAGATKGTSQTLETIVPGTYTVRVTMDGDPGESPPFKLSGQFDDQNFNYIVTTEAQVKNLRVDTVELMPIDSISQKIEYFDGLGRPMQTVVTQGSPGKQDIVQQVGFDDFGRQTYQYLPFTSGSSGSLKLNVLDANGLPNSILTALYQNSSDAIADDTAAYSKTLFELSELNRVIEAGAPGADFQPGSGHTVKTSYLTNGATEVLRFVVNAGTVYVDPQAKYVSANQLSVSKVLDEHSGEIKTYTDKEGRTICKRVKASLTEYADTYYVFDIVGNLVAVLPPEAIKRILEQL